MTMFEKKVLREMLRQMNEGNYTTTNCNLIFRTKYTEGEYKKKVGLGRTFLEKERLADKKSN